MFKPGAAVIALVFASVFASVLPACGNETGARHGLGGTCEDSSECAAGQCLAGRCLDPDGDEDHDGLSNRVEVSIGTDPLVADSDHDGILDGDELLAGSDVDSDGDGKSDALESAVADADGDCLPDQIDPDDAHQDTDLSKLVTRVCRRVGVCAAAIDDLVVTCDASFGVQCDYGAVAGFEPIEVTCDQKDNDCDGQTDEDLPPGRCAATLLGLTIAPSAPAVKVGQAVPLAVYGAYDNGESRDVTSLATWSSSAPSIAEISSTGVVTGRAEGRATITVTVGDKTATTGVDVSAATLVSVRLDPAEQTVPAGMTATFRALATYDDDSEVDRSSAAQWSTALPAIAVAGEAGAIASKAPGDTLVVATIDRFGATATLHVTSATVATLAFAEPSYTAPIGAAVPLEVRATFSDGTSGDVTGSVGWTVAPPAVVSIEPGGLARADALGTTTITATLGQATATTSFESTAVTRVSLDILPQAPSVAVGDTIQLVLSSVDSAGHVTNAASEATWSALSGAVEIAGPGLVKGLVEGTAVVRAIIGSLAAEVSVTVTAPRATGPTLVSVALEPAEASVVTGQTTSFALRATYDDTSSVIKTADALWSSTSPAIATVAGGVVTGHAPGDCVVLATLGDLSAAGTVHVTGATVTSIAFDAASYQAAVGSGTPVVVTATFSDGSQGPVTGSVSFSANAAIVVVEPGGMARATGVGTTTITATLAGKTATASFTATAATTASLTLLPALPSLRAGETLQLVLAATDTAGSSRNAASEASWTSLAPSIATVSSTGLVTGVTAGSASIRATLGTSSATVTVTVLAGVTPPAPSVTSVTVEPSDQTAAVGTSATFIAKAHYSDGSTVVHTAEAAWSSTAPAVATAGAGGVITPKAAGDTIIVALYGGVGGQATLHVTPATVSSLAFDAASYTGAVGNSVPVKVTATFSDSSVGDVTGSVTWQTGSGAIVTVSGGLAQVAGVGTTQITASFGGKSASASFVGTAATTASITILPLAPSLAKNTTLQLTLSAVDSTGQTRNAAAEATWTSLATSIATVSSTGLVTGKLEGTATVRATLGTLTANVTVTVTPAPTATITEVRIFPASPAVEVGLTRQLVAVAHASDGTWTEVTTQSTWESLATATATVDAAGVARGVAAGSATIRATYQGTAGTTSLTVQAASARLVTISVTPLGPSLNVGQTVQLAARGDYANNTTADLTNQVIWQSQASGVASVSGTGLVTAVAAGVAVITASKDGVVGSTVVVVSQPGGPAETVEFHILPEEARVGAGAYTQLRGWVIRSDGSLAEVSTQVTWTSLSPDIATVDSYGNVHGLVVGTALIHAQLGSLSDETTVTVFFAPPVGFLVEHTYVRAFRGQTAAELPPVTKVYEHTRPYVSMLQPYTPSGPVLIKWAYERTRPRALVLGTPPMATAADITKFAFVHASPAVKVLTLKQSLPGPLTFFVAKPPVSVTIPD